MRYQESIDDDVLTVSLKFSNGGYLLWQKSINIDATSEIYFEYNDQINGGYDSLREISIMRDGLHIVKSDRTLEHFYFEKPFSDYSKFVSGVEKIYDKTPSILDIIDR